MVSANIHFWLVPIDPHGSTRICPSPCLIVATICFHHDIYLTDLFDVKAFAGSKCLVCAVCILPCSAITDGIVNHIHI